MKPPSDHSSDGSTMEAKPEDLNTKQQAILQNGAMSLQAPVEEEKEEAPSILKYIEQEVEKLSSQTQIFQKTQLTIPKVAVFDRKEVVVSSVLGKGAFSEVSQVWGFRLALRRRARTNSSSSISLREPPPEEEEEDDERLALRECLTHTALTQHGYSRYAIKHLRKDLFDTDSTRNTSKFIHAASDLVMEAKFLMQLQHPNICPIRGWSGGVESFGNAGCDSFFVILDRLDQTLAHRIVQWKMIPLCQQQVWSKQLSDYREKVDIALQLARGLQYLHDQHIIFRDLKPDNVGFRGPLVQIFDFGLCRELPSINGTMMKQSENSKFHMSGVGTRRYMAPEIFLTQHYNLKADVYSWTIVFHTMLSLTRPFEQYNAAMHKLLVCHEGGRPSVLGNWPAEIRHLLTDGWAQNPDDRPSMAQVIIRLETLQFKIDHAMQQQHLHGEQSYFQSAGRYLEETLDTLVGDCWWCRQDERKKFNEQAAQLFRTLETQIVEGTAAGSNWHHTNNNATTQSRMGGATTCDYPKVRHLRSQHHLRSHYL